MLAMSVYAAALMEEMSDESSSNGSSSSSASSSSSSSSMDSSSSNSTTLSDKLATALQAVNEVYNDIEGGMEDESIEWRGKRLLVDDLSDDDSIFHFQFRKKHLQELVNKLWPQLEPYLIGSKTAIIFDDWRYSCPYQTLLLMAFFRFSRPRRIRKEMERFFGIRRSKISSGIKAMVDEMHSLALLYLDNSRIFHHKMPYYHANRIFNKCGLVATVWGFIDGTLKKTCRLSFFQKLLYSGHKRCHGIKFQSIVTPDGLFACMYGPITGNWHDSFMLARSQFMERLRAFFYARTLKSRKTCWWGGCILPVRRSCISTVNVCIWRLQKSTPRISSGFVEHTNVESARSCGMGIGEHHYKLIVPGF
jgi:hypothetical protein